MQKSLIPKYTLFREKGYKMYRGLFIKKCMCSTSSIDQFSPKISNHLSIHPLSMLWNFEYLFGVVNFFFQQLLVIFSANLLVIMKFSSSFLPIILVQLKIWLKFPTWHISNLSTCCQCVYLSTKLFPTIH